MKNHRLEAEIARMSRLRAAHFDDQLAIRRAERDARDALAFHADQAAALEKDIARRRPTSGDRFECSIVTPNGRQNCTERPDAGAALCIELVTSAHMSFVGEKTIASIGGFDLVFNGWQHRSGGYEYETVLTRAAKDLAVDLPLTVTPKGAIARLEHAIGSFEDELAATLARKAEAERKLASYGGRAAEGFPLEAELNLKLAELEALDCELAATAEGPIVEAT